MADPRGYGFGREGIDAALEAADEPLLSDDEWDLVGDLFLELNGEADYDFAAQRILQVRRSQSGRVRQRKAASREMEPVEVPQHWRHQCERLFRAYREDAAVALLILGVDEPLAPEGLGDYLTEVATRERDEGDVEAIAYLDTLGNVCHVRLRRGYTQKELREAVKRGEAKRFPVWPPKGVSEREHRANPQAVPGRNMRIDWIAPRTNRLCRIADLARKIAKQTGCHEAEATMFLLCDIVPQLPWLEAVVFKFDSGRRHAFDIHVGSPLVPAEDVRRFYIQVREQASHPLIGGQTKRGRNPWTYELLTFVEERRKKGWYWEGIFEEWNEQFPDHPYKSVPAMQRSFYQARGKPSERDGASVTMYPRVFRPRNPQ
ncbi:MAG TPA: hypothetical protein VFE45_14685 [Coriobacteriia bacterium]|nr:hypothetical protein [Coriobacteriia bacterium]